MTGRLADYSVKNSTRNPDCNGMCLSSGDIGLGGDAVAYPHPLCSAHGDGCPGFQVADADQLGRLYCTCRALQTEHDDQLTPALGTLEVTREINGGYIDNATEIMDKARTLKQMRAVMGWLAGRN